MKPLTDLDPMPFGMHKGKPMQEVPVKYLHWLWSQPSRDGSNPVIAYVRQNLHALALENPDLIWE